MSQVAAAQADSPWKNMLLCPSSNAQLRLTVETTLNGALQENALAVAITALPAWAGAVERIVSVVCGAAPAGVLAGETPAFCAF